MFTIPDLPERPGAVPAPGDVLELGGSAGSGRVPIDFQQRTRRGLARWFRNVSARVLAGQPVNILCGIDSLTAGSGGFSYIQPFRRMVQDALGDGGIGFQLPSIDWEFGNSAVGYAGFSTPAIDPAVVDERRNALSILSLYKETVGGAVTFNAGTHASVNRETDEVDVFFLKFPTGATSLRMYGFPSGTVYNGISANEAAPAVAKQTLIDFGKAANWRASTAALDQHNGPVRYLGFNFRRTCPGGGARVHFWAKGGSKTQEWAALNASSLQYLSAELALDLAILCPGMNDRNTRTKAEYKADLEKIITNFRSANANVAILLFFPTIPAVGAGALPDFREAMLELAVAYDCAFVDTATILGANAEAVAQGLIQVDGVHPTERGFRLEADYLFNFIGGASLHQLRHAVYNVWAPRRDIDATAVQGWKPGTVAAFAQDFSQPLRATRLNKYYTTAEPWRIHNLSEIDIPNTVAAAAVKVFDLGLINGSPEADLEFEVTLSRVGTGSRVRRRFYVSLSNTTGISQRATGSVRAESELKFKNLAGDALDIDATVSVTNNGATNRCEVYVTPTGGGGGFSNFVGIVEKARVVFAYSVTNGQSVFEF